MNRFISAVALAGALSLFSSSTLCFAAAPTHAGSAPLRPLIELIRTNPAFHQEIVSQIALLPTLTPAVLSQASLAVPAVAASPDAAVRAEAARVVLGLVARPEAVASSRAELTSLLGLEGAQALEKAAQALQQTAVVETNSDLGRKLLKIREEVDVVHAGNILGLRDRLSRLFEGAGVHAAAEDAGAVTAGESQRRPSNGLQRPVGVMDAQALNAYLASRSVISPRGMKRANFESGDYRPEYDEQLRRSGYDLVVIKNPARKEVQAYSEDQGFYLKSDYVRWVMPARPIERYMADMKSDRRRKLEREIERSAHLVIERGPLTVEQFEEWYPVYEDEVVGKPGGKRNVERDFARKQLAEKGTLDTWYGVFYRDPQTKEIVGGVILKDWKERGMLVLGYAAYRQSTKPYYMSVRTFVEGMSLALERGAPVLSFGQDTNLFGYDYNLGLMENKARFHLTPYPEDAIVLLKVLSPAKFWDVGTADGKRGGHFFFALKRDSTVARSYLEARDASAEPPEAQHLLGSDRYFTPDIVSSQETLYGAHFYGDDVRISGPDGIDIVRRPMERTIDTRPTP